jgi:ComF family protein
MTAIRTAVGEGISNEMREALKEAVNLILPYKCAICGNVSDTEGRFGEYNRLYRKLYGTDNELHICGNCLSALNSHEEDRRWLLCLSNPMEGDPYPGLALYMQYPYKGIVSCAVPKIKFGKQIQLARFFGCLLGSSLLCEGIEADLVIPVPLSEQRYKERGFNQAGEMAYPIAAMNHIPFAGNCLVRTRDTKRQAKIKDAGERTRNVAGAFRVNEDWDVTDLTVLLVDDVATSGSTLHEAATALYKAGASQVLCVAFAGNRSVMNAEPY